MSERVYNSLKKDLLDGLLGSGRVAIPTLERRYHASATPIREALLRLVGERLIDMPPTGGFSTRRVEEIEARHLYEFAQRLLIAAVGWRKDGHSVTEGNPRGSTLSPAVDDLFAIAAERSRNSFLISTMDALNDRLHSLRRAEHLVLTGLDREFAALNVAVLGARTGNARRIIIAYHQRRLRRLLLILRASHA